MNIIPGIIMYIFVTNIPQFEKTNYLLKKHLCTHDIKTKIR